MATALTLPVAALDRLMPLHLRLSAEGRITGYGPTRAKLLERVLPGQSLLGRGLFEAFDLRRPSGLTTMADLRAHAGETLKLTLHGVGPNGVGPNGVALNRVGPGRAGPGRAGPGAVALNVAGPGGVALNGVGPGGAALTGAVPNGVGRPMALRGLAQPLAKGAGMVLNLSFGIGVVDAVRSHALTASDFAATDLAVEMMYLVEANTAAMDALRGLARRLRGDKLLAEAQALTDTLTGLRNRRALSGVLDGLTRSAEGFGLMHIDLDYFKTVNDTLGHAAGDHVLRVVACVLEQETRAGDTVARVGGDEFVVVFPGLADAVQLDEIAQRIIEELTRPIEFEGQMCRFSASIGVTMSTYYDPPEADRMQHDADEALYASKRAGRGRSQFYQPNGADRRRA